MNRCSVRMLMKLLICFYQRRFESLEFLYLVSACSRLSVFIVVDLSSERNLTGVITRLPSCLILIIFVMSTELL